MLIGIALCLVYIKTNSLLNTIIIHFMINAIAVVAYYKDINLNFAKLNLVVFVIALVIVVMSYYCLNNRSNS